MTKKEDNSDIVPFIERKIHFFQDTIQKTILNIYRNKLLDVLGTSEVNACIRNIQNLTSQLQLVTPNQSETAINTLQNINTELSSIFKMFGTESFDDLLWVCFGSNDSSIYTNTSVEKSMLELLKKYFHPISYKVNTNTSAKKELECTDVSSKRFNMKVYGIQVHIYNNKQKKSLIVTGILDNVVVNLLKNKYIDEINEALNISDPIFLRYVSSLTLKDYLLNTSVQLIEKFAGYKSNLSAIKSKSLNHLVSEFVQADLFVKRLTIIQLLIDNSCHENQYKAYLLYDLLSNETNNDVDTKEQIHIFDSLPWSIREYFKESMKQTIEYTSSLTNVEHNKIPLEQQICLLKAPDSVKEKAILKLKELKSKADDSGSKARQYLEGLLRIPFGTYRREPILTVMDSIKERFMDLVKTNQVNVPIKKDSYTSLEIIKYLGAREINKSKPELLDMINQINIKLKEQKQPLIRISGKTKEQLKEEIIKYEKNHSSDVSLESSYNQINTYMKSIRTILDKSVYGHDKAKRQIERIIGQWINGTQDGYCIGFEGSPGVGKTSLAKKGIAYCLQDENQKSRPFGMIQLGGDSNGSSIHGHSYTYVGSTWGSIVQILMDTKCMNPIILIDEVDKISKTEQGREIVGILTHLLDPTQNDSFQDKYFAGINLDLSKALFIISYNDVDAIDRILLDRVHRIRFDNLTMEDKLVISKDYLLPEIYEKFGLKGMLEFNDETLKKIIEEYTLEPGVRKLKEVLSEIVGEINLDILKNFDTQYDIPIKITMDDIKNKYFKEKYEVKTIKIHKENKIGTICGLWANNLNCGGVIPIQSNWRPSDKFLSLHLTGMQGDVMKESMNVALTLAWNITSQEVKDTLLKYNLINGVHVHCPEGATPKDGPSAGTAITVTIYSLFNHKKIKNTVAITGEINLDGHVTEIGGLELKILGGIKAGVKEFIFPKENHKDYEKFEKKYGNTKIVEGIVFHEVDHIDQVLELVFE
jgi:ATP-dependent Lon protease